MVEQRRPVQSVHGGEWRTVTQKGGKSCQGQNPSKPDIQGERGTKHVPEQKPIYDNSPLHHSTRNRYFVTIKRMENQRIKITQPVTVLGGSLNLVFTVKLRTSTLFLLKLLLVAHRPSPSTHSVVHRPSHTRSLWPSHYHSLFCGFLPSGSHIDIPIPLTPFMNWAKTKGASLISLNQHKTDNSFLFWCNHVTILIQTTKIVCNLSLHTRL